MSCTLKIFYSCQDEVKSSLGCFCGDGIWIYKTVTLSLDLDHNPHRSSVEVGRAFEIRRGFEGDEELAKSRMDEGF